MKKLAAVIYLFNGKIVSSNNKDAVISDDPVKYASTLAKLGIDELIIHDLSSEDEEHELNLLAIREIGVNTDLSMIATGNIKRLEDVKKIIYAGCRCAALDYSVQSNIELTCEASKRFGKESIAAIISEQEDYLSNKELIDEFTSYVIDCSNIISIDSERIIRIVSYSDADSVISEFDNKNIVALAFDNQNLMDIDYCNIKNVMEEKGIKTQSLKTDIAFSDLKKNSDGHVPVVVQDYESNEVLMVAYMNEDAFNKTIETGIMTYYSRSREELWIKGDTSGHYQYVKELKLDCDNDTILAKVKQIGNACHTGSYSCFFKDIASKEYVSDNPMKVFDDVFNVILDRKQNPKEGSYTNYLFDKGIDKILKKVGEEATEIVIAAKNPGKEEVKYEIADFLYHMMVLMAECNLDWKDITKELANR